MPTIQSRKYPDNIQFVDSGTWAEMQKKGIARRFRVTDDSDLADAIIEKPNIIMDLTQGETETPEPNRAEIKAKLDELEVEYNTRASTDSLLLLLNENEPTK